MQETASGSEVECGNTGNLRLHWFFEVNYLLIFSVLVD